MRHAMVWGVLAGALCLLGGSAIATPMSDKDYSTRIVVETDFQNSTCAEIEYLEHVFNEMLGRCPPADAFGGVQASAPVPTRNGVTLRTPPIVQPFTYTPPRVCPDQSPPTYRLSPELYAELGPTLRAYLTSAGIPWDVDIQPGENKGRPLSTQQTYFSGPISAAEHDLTAAAALKNCHVL